VYKVFYVSPEKYCQYYPYIVSFLLHNVVNNTLFAFSIMNEINIKQIQKQNLTKVIRSFARSRARSGDTKHANPFNATPASYIF